MSMPVWDDATRSEVRPARLEDIPRLVELMGEFYAEAHYALDVERAKAAFEQLVTDDRLGRVWLIEHDRGSVGYAVLTFGFSMEFGGLNAVIDDLFIEPPFRRRGLGRIALAQIIASCRVQGVRALHLETEPTNAAAMHVYRGVGFQERHRQLMTLRLDAPLHID